MVHVRNPIFYNTKKESDDDSDNMDTDNQKVEQDGEWVDVAHDPEADLDEDDIKVKSNGSREDQTVYNEPAIPL